MNPKVYQGEALREISFPLGGIGAGCLGLDGYGRLVDWEIFNRPNKRSVNGYSHFAVKAERNGTLLDARVMNMDAQPGYMGGGYLDAQAGRKLPGPSWRSNYGFGPQRELMGGMPHFRGGAFEGRFPFARIRFEDEAFPGKVSLAAFNPFIPLDDKNSSLPAAFFTVTLKNTREEPLDYTVALSLGNPQTGLHKNEIFAQDGAAGLCLTDDTPAGDPLAGELVMAVAQDAAPAFQPYWFRGSWFDDLSLFWQDFTAPGPIRSRDYAPDEAWRGKRDTATLTLRASLRPGEARDFRFVVAWYYPTCVNYWRPVKDGEPCARSWKNYYASLFGSAREAAAYALKHWDSLEARTRCFAETLYASDLPEAALEAVGADIAVLKSPTCLRLEKGEFYAFEGCGMNAGSCEGSCTHVWNYAFALPFLFPKLERSMRELDYAYSQGPDGGMAFRLQLPLGRARSTFRPCVDGLMGGVIKFYREWKICGDDEWLKTWWPKVKKSLAYAWSPENPDRWDPDKTGVITGRQHHTLDMELFGPSAWLEGFYLAALKAAREIAAHLGEAEDAALYERLYELGRAFTEEALFNGEYFVQKIDLTDKGLLAPFAGAASTYWNGEAGEIKYQIQDGCGIDQVLAQWMSEMSGLGEILDRDKVDSALSAVYRHNFKPELRGHVNPCRVYGLNDEAGTVMFDWPEGMKKPVVPVPYAEETMHGFEYQAASHLIAHGFEAEGLRMVKAVRDRYDGRRRNPWNEMECGSNYARSMASWALMLVYSGLVCDLPRGRLGFRPLKGRGRFFWSVEGAWGQAEVNQNRLSLRVIEGSLPLRQLVMEGADKAQAVYLNGQEVRFTAQADGLLLDTEAIAAGSELTVIKTT
ncbi:MAG: hypothetical protein IJ048_02660 [Clostridia bacterium]|nr:hypothetical protein [Clostridia bacterium]